MDKSDRSSDFDFDADIMEEEEPDEKDEKNEYDNDEKK